VSLGNVDLLFDGDLLGTNLGQTSAAELYDKVTGMLGALKFLGADPINPVTVEPPVLTGDYNQNGRVDAIDSVVWRESLGKDVSPFSGADGNGNGVIDQDDYNVFRSNYGRTATTIGAETASGSVQSVVGQNGTLAGNGIPSNNDAMPSASQHDNPAPQSQIVSPSAILNVKHAADDRRGAARNVAFREWNATEVHQSRIRPQLSGNETAAAQPDNTNSQVPTSSRLSNAFRSRRQRLRFGDSDLTAEFKAAVDEVMAVGIG
jgi:hypothetical protein